MCAASPPALPTKKNENCGLQEIGLHLASQSGPGGPCGHPCSAGAAATAAPAHLCCRGSCARAPCPTCPPTSAHSQPARPSLGPLLPALRAVVSKAGARLISFDFLAPSISQSAQCRQVIAHEQHGLHPEPLLRCSSRQGAAGRNLAAHADGARRKSQPLTFSLQVFRRVRNVGS